MRSNVVTTGFALGRTGIAEKKLKEENMKIKSTRIIGNTTGFHSVIATLENGKTVIFKNCASGQSLYPQENGDVEYFETPFVEAGVEVFPAHIACILARGERTHVCGVLNIIGPRSP